MTVLSERNQTLARFVSLSVYAKHFTTNTDIQMKRTLAPPSRSDNLRVVALRLPEAIIDLIDKIGNRQIRSRSDVIRALAIEALQTRGLVEHGGAILDEVA